jgi:cupin 2 domain-containing protein
MIRSGNLLANVPAVLAEEQVDALLSRPGVRVERIVSTGQASPENFWYDQPQDEWVCVISGAARVLIEGEPVAREMRAGDWLELPAHVRHRVEWTDVTQPTVWLAVHIERG